MSGDVSPSDSWNNEPSGINKALLIVTLSPNTLGILGVQEFIRTWHCGRMSRYTLPPPGDGSAECRQEEDGGDEEDDRPKQLWRPTAT